MADWVRALAAEAAAGRRAVLVSVAHAAGSTPREAGAAMVVTAAHTHGTIGGGHLEFEAIRIARDALANPLAPAPWVVRFPLAARLGQCCGGAATLAFVMVACPGWLEAAATCERTAVAFALVTRIGPGGEASRQMLVTADDATGSLGDPALDSDAIAVARPRAQARATGAWMVPATSHAGRTLLVHAAAPAEFTILVFGNGHVGRALVQVLGALPAHVRWIDGREHDFPAEVPNNVEVVTTDAPGDELADAPAGAYVLILTHSHALDFVLLESALQRDDWRYLGVIGSKSKRNQFEKRLAARGVAPALLEHIVCPIGTSAVGIRGKEPGAIAVAVAAELLVLRERALGRPGSADAPRLWHSHGHAASRRTS